MALGSAPSPDRLQRQQHRGWSPPDMVGSRFAGIVDSQATIAERDHCVLYVWYDNEFGYSCQVVRVMEQMAGVVRQDLPV